MMSKKRILLCVTAGIAIYKVVDLVSRLIKREYELEIIMTESATKLISPLVFETMGKCKVHTDMFHLGHHEEVEHIELAKRADLCLIAPATANTVAKITYGIADNLLTSTVLAYNRDLMIALAMNTNMLNNKATVENIEKLKQRGVQFINPEVGVLACNTIGDGRLAEPEEIARKIDEYFIEKDLKGKKIIVTAGPTTERIDPVRYITNDSSGKMGYAIAENAKKRGAEVILISGPSSIEVPKEVESIFVNTNNELKQAIEKNFNWTDCLIMAAAPCDFKVKEVSGSKIKKTGSNLILELKENEDILAYFGNKKNNKLLIGFAAETDSLIENAKSKLKRKNLDYIIANDITKPDAGFNVDTNRVKIISKNKIVDLPLMLKREVANNILDLIK
ncbi:bifunctional phosphopantothenoylcysteine decarboxylase/phosphopantothenate--cysteine ligase CoaBC [Miniphocaeibacter massiliensis]|uniref:bifunctional phosphopantothenoylcysteine decarboxylase/phosphopantothenate--cysteine ligase CoaBC n=1 Tax=Miniphocaeibacter massiliensis TaxID=2041841 RepID=UPI000C087F7E|nr:bifunctional phosphopantothenoylcysteine decarboxylase/phosphopantothenate--cysteine ligase CoaBC [Miniphocaeibacter massiliensis]